MNSPLRSLLDRFGATGSFICAVHCALTPVLLAAIPSLGLLLVGLAILWAGILYPPLHDSVLPHAITMTLGGAMVAFAHLINLRLNHWHVHDATCAH